MEVVLGRQQERYCGSRKPPIERWWFAPPNQPALPAISGGAYTDSSTGREPPIYARKFSSPGVTSTKSFYVMAEGDTEFNVKEVQFLDHFDRVP
jgi:hypothetical protein